MVFKVFEIKILLLLARYKNKSEYVSSGKVGKYKGEACINGQAVLGKNIRWSGTAHVSKKIRRLLPRDKRFSEAIKERTSNRIKE